VDQPTKLIGTVQGLIWNGDLDLMPRWRAVVIAPIRFAYVLVRDLSQGNLNLRAMSLVYTTLLSIVPLLAISFSVLKGFGVQNQMQPLLENLLAPLGEQGTEVTRQIIGFVDNMKVGVLGAVGLGLLIWTVISLMQKIEAAFNFAWRVTQVRPFARRFGDYLSVILVGPVLAFSSLGATASLAALDLGEFSAVAPIFKSVIGLVPYLLIVAAFTFIYSFLPNTKVTIKAAFFGALVAGLLWNVAGWIFASFVVGSAKYTAIYSAFATLILFLIWLYTSWLILLIGAAIGYYVQHPEAVRLTGGEAKPGGATREALALAFALHVARGHLRGEAPSCEELASAARMPLGSVVPVLAALERARILVVTAEDPPRYVPGRAIGTISLKSVLDAVRRADADGAPELRRATTPPDVAALLGDIERGTEAALAGRTLADAVAATRAAA
jgi:membrane protein